MTNLKPIRKGDDYWFQIKVWSDTEKTTLKDLTSVDITITARYANGTTAFQKTNGQLQSPDQYRRIFILSESETDALTSGEVLYEIDTIESGISKEYARGYILIQ
jgi:hypothetical protein